MHAMPDVGTHECKMTDVHWHASKLAYNTKLNVDLLFEVNAVVHKGEMLIVSMPARATAAAQLAQCWEECYHALGGVWIWINACFTSPARNKHNSSNAMLCHLIIFLSCYSPSTELQRMIRGAEARCMQSKQCPNHILLHDATENLEHTKSKMQVR